MTRIHTINGKDVLIDWTICNDIEDDSGDGHGTYHYADGVSEDGRVWLASVTKVDDVVEEIYDIEETEVVK